METASLQFVYVDIDDAASLEAALKGVSLVVHTAGPFQRKDTCGVLEAAIATGTPYMDVCDDTDHSQRLRAYSDKAKAAGVPAITTAGRSWYLMLPSHAAFTLWRVHSIAISCSQFWCFCHTIPL